jgi:hypothetical protein
MNDLIARRTRTALRQLETLGFADTVAYNMSGAAVRDDTHDSTTYFLTRKAT